MNLLNSSKKDQNKKFKKNNKFEKLKKTTEEDNAIRITTAINQYLIKSGFTTSAMALQNECQQKNIPIKTKETEKILENSNIYKIMQQNLQKLIDNFEKGESQNFFKIWNEFTHQFKDAKNKNIFGVLEFRLKVYFATIPLRTNPQDKNEYRKRINELKNYLENDLTSQMANKAELVQYFALPYIPEPQKHPIFKELLKEKWVQTLQESFTKELQKFIDNLYNINISNEKIIEILEEPLMPLDPDIDDLENDKLSITNNNNSVNCNIIANELIDCLKNSSLNDSEIPKILTAIFDRFGNNRQKIATSITRSQKTAPNTQRKTMQILRQRTDEILLGDLKINYDVDAKMNLYGQNKSAISSVDFSISPPPTPPNSNTNNNNNHINENINNGTFILCDSNNEKNSKLQNLNNKFGNELRNNRIGQNGGLSTGLKLTNNPRNNTNTKESLKKSESMGNLIPTDPPANRTISDGYGGHTATTPKNSTTLTTTIATAATPTTITNTNVKTTNKSITTTSKNSTRISMMPTTNTLNSNKNLSKYEITTDDDFNMAKFNNNNIVNNIELFDELDYAKISTHLLTNTNKRSCALLIQALRQQITYSSSLHIANKRVQLFATKDILLLRNRKNSVVATILAQYSTTIPLQNIMLSSANNNSQQQQNCEEAVAEELARFLNAIASFHCGRVYLLSMAQGKELLYQLANALRQKKFTSFAGDHILAALQKMSIRSVVQKELILSGMIEWLILTYFNEYTNNLTNNTSAFISPQNNSEKQSTTTTFGLEYATALLMNLSQNTISQSTLLRHKDQLYNLLLRLLNSPHRQIAPYVNGTLYCLLGLLYRFRQIAKERGELETILLNKISKKGLPNLERIQLEIVLQMLRGEIEFVRKKRNPMDEEDQDFEDYLEAEIDSTDRLVPVMTELFGETLLRRRFTYFETISPPRSRSVNVPPSVASSVLSSSGAVPGAVLPSLPQQNGSANSGGVTKKRQRRKVPVSSQSIVRRQQQQQQNNNNGIMPLRGPSIVRFDMGSRTTSMMSHTTFILENNKRKPLLVPSGFQEAVATAAATLTTTKNDTNNNNKNNVAIISQNIILEENLPTGQQVVATTITTTTPTTTISAAKGKRSRSGQKIGSGAKKVAIVPENNNNKTITTNENGNKIVLSNEKSGKISSSIEKISSKNTPTTNLTNIEDSESLKEEYMTIFGARPKVIRTPDTRDDENFVRNICNNNRQSFQQHPSTRDNLTISRHYIPKTTNAR